MRILGIDPGLTKTGFGILDVHNESLKVVDYGIIKPKSKDKLEKRLLIIFKDISAIIKEYKPTIVCIEEVFYGKNFKSALLLGQARGAAMVSAASEDITIFEYSAKKIKQSVISSLTLSNASLLVEKTFKIGFLSSNFSPTPRISL